MRVVLREDEWYPCLTFETWEGDMFERHYHEEDFVDVPRWCWYAYRLTLWAWKKVCKHIRAKTSPRR